MDNTCQCLKLLHRFILAIKFSGFIFDLCSLGLIRFSFLLDVLSHILITKEEFSSNLR